MSLPAPQQRYQQRHLHNPQPLYAQQGYTPPAARSGSAAGYGDGKHEDFLRQERQGIMPTAGESGGVDGRRSDSVPGQRGSEWKGSSMLKQQGRANGYDGAYDTPIDRRESSGIRASSAPGLDVVGRHLLVETALLDSQSFEVLEIQEVDALKKEHARLTSRVEGTRRKLTLESKVKQAAQSLQRLYSSKEKGGRPTTPSSPKSPRKSGRASLLSARQRSSSGASGSGAVGTDTLSQAEDELQSSSRKVEEFNAALAQLEDRRQYVERRLLRHTAAVLQAAHRDTEVSQQARGLGPEDGQLTLRMSGYHTHTYEADLGSVYSGDEYDSVRGILAGQPGAQIDGMTTPMNAMGTQVLREEHEQQMSGVQARLEQLNQQLRAVIADASRPRSNAPEPVLGLEPEEDEDAMGRVNRQLTTLERSLQRTEEGQRVARQRQNQLQDEAKRVQDAVEGQLEVLNIQLHNTLLLSSATQSITDLEGPPQITGHGCQAQFQYLEDSLLTVEQLRQQRAWELQTLQQSQIGSSRELEDAQAFAKVHADKANQYETVLGGLWEILQTGSSAREAERDIVDPSAPPLVPFKGSFSLQAFSASVQHIFDRATSAKEQQDILRRQVQQQRELNAKSDAEKDRHCTDLQCTHDALRGEHETIKSQHAQLQTERDAAQDHLAQVVAKHATAETELGGVRAGMLNIMNELEQLRRKGSLRDHDMARSTEHVKQLSTQVEEHQTKERQLLAELEGQRNRTQGVQEHVESLEVQISELTDDARIFSVEAQGKEVAAAKKHQELHASLAASNNAREAAQNVHTSLATDMTNLEQEVIRLTTELTFARAELDAAKGSRSARAKESAMSAEVKEKLAGIDVLTARHAEMERDLASARAEKADQAAKHDTVLAQLADLQTRAVSSKPSDQQTESLQKELEEMTSEFHDLTRETLQLEREREQLETLIDGLRDRCEALEAQVNDEKVRWLGIKSPTNGAASEVGREMTSTTVLRQEFKKMIREARAEGVRLLRGEQDERRRLEAQLRSMRQADGPLAKHSQPMNGSAVNGAAAGQPPHT